MLLITLLRWLLPANRRAGRTNPLKINSRNLCVEQLEDRIALSGSPTTTAVAESLASTVYGQSEIFTATVSTSATGTLSGKVEFLDGTTVLGTSSLNSSGIATFKTSSLQAGSHSITAEYLGTTSFQSSTSSTLAQTVVPASTQATLLGWSNPVLVGTPVTFVATITPQAPGFGVPTGTVDFLEGTKLLGTGTLNKLGVASLTTSKLPVGTASIAAVYLGSSNFVARESLPVSETVTATSTTASISGDGSVDAGAVTFNFAVQNPGGKSSPTGTFEMYNAQQGFDLVSTSITSAVVATGGASATFTGTGTLNGVSGYKFTVQVQTGSSANKISIAITGPSAFSYSSGLLAIASGGTLHIGTPPALASNLSTLGQAAKTVLDDWIAASEVHFTIPVVPSVTGPVDIPL